jgi:hypothetical protein
MNQQFGNNISAQKPAYDRAQSALGCPAVDTLQVDESVNSLGEAVEFHMETVRALLRRLHPVTGDIVQGVGVTSGGASPQPCKVPLCYRIDNRRDELHELTGEVQSVIRALQI